MYFLVSKCNNIFDTVWYFRIYFETKHITVFFLLLYLFSSLRNISETTLENYAKEIQIHCNTSFVILARSHINKYIISQKKIYTQNEIYLCEETEKQR